MLEIQQSFCDKKLEIIAEAGCNHAGDLATALEMVRQAKFSGATTIKFQSFKADKLVNPAPDVLEFCRTSQLSYEDHCAIIDECEEQDIKPLFSVFDSESFELLLTLGINEIKVPSGQVFNGELLEKIASAGLFAYVSTGMCSMRHVERAFHILTETGLSQDRIALLQCTTSYPAPFEDANLLVMNRYEEEFGTKVGYSDHTCGWSAAIAAVALGAQVIEKHFMLNDSLSTPDACVSLNPVEFRMMCNHLHEAQLSRGTPIKRLRQSERKMLKRRDFRRSKNGI